VNLIGSLDFFQDRNDEANWHKLAQLVDEIKRCVVDAVPARSAAVMTNSEKTPATLICFMLVYATVAIRPRFSGTVPIFNDVSKNAQVSQDG